MMTNEDIFKQLTINSFVIPTELQEQVKQFVFYDKVEAEARRNKRGLNNQLRLGLTYVSIQLSYPHGHWGISYRYEWGISYRYELQLQGINCPCCGNFRIANNEDITTMTPSIACHCEYEYVTEIVNQVESTYWRFNNGRHQGQNDEDEEQIPEIDYEIDYGVDNLLRHF